MTKLYLMKNSKGLYKIGISNNPSRRVKEVERTAKTSTRIIACYPLLFSYQIEQRLHKRFSHKSKQFRGSGKSEYFKLGFIEAWLLRSQLFLLLTIQYIVLCTVLISLLSFAYLLLSL